MLRQVLYSVRSERQLTEPAQYDSPYPWFIGLSMDDEVWLSSVYDAAEFIQCLAMNVLPHVAQNKCGRSHAPDAIAQSESYAISQRKRKLIEQGFGWAKSVGGMRQMIVRGIKRVDQMFVVTMSAYNLVRVHMLEWMGQMGQVRSHGT